MIVRITPCDNGWNMGEDLKVELDHTSNVRELAAAIHREKGISPSQMCFLLPGDADQAIAIPTAQWDRQLSDFRITDGSTVRLEPLNSGCWQWHDTKYYEEQTIRRMTKAVQEAGKDGISMSKLQEKVPLPPPMMAYKYVPFVRMHADHFYVETDTTTRKIQVWLNRGGWVPVWL